MGCSKDARLPIPQHMVADAVTTALILIRLDAPLVRIDFIGVLQYIR